MPKFEIWCEGFVATGEHQTATRMGVVDAPTFRDACLVRFEGLGQIFNADRLTYWGSRLFDNETDARASFG